MGSGGPQPPQPSQPERPAGYGGPVPPGGWHQPPAPPPPGVGGRHLAGWGARVGATLLDGLVVSVLSLLLVAPGVVVLAVSDADAIGVVLTVLGGLLALGLWLFYGAYFVQRPGEHNGQTLGKQLVGIRAVRDNGEPFSFGTGMLREFVVKTLLFGTVGGWFAGIPWLLDVLWPLWDDQNRALHDMLVTTHVVRQPRA